MMKLPPFTCAPRYMTEQGIATVDLSPRRIVALWHTLPLVRLIPGILDDLEPVGIDDEALGAAGFNLFCSEKRSRPGLHGHRIFRTKRFYIGVEISDRTNELFFSPFPI